MKPSKVDKNKKKDKQQTGGSSVPAAEINAYDSQHDLVLVIVICTIVI
jgi:hypothetical protein